MTTRIHTCEDTTATPCNEELASVALIHLDKGLYVFWYCAKHGEEQLKRRDTWRAGAVIVKTEEQQQLEQSVLQSCVTRGHRMTPFARLYEQKHISESVCEKCEAYAQVNTKPAPNQIAIGGTAVALKCRTGN
jgi:hypothetical protein